MSGLISKKNTPLVSIIMPCYRKEQYIAETLASVEAQTHSEWELILIDDSSPDDTTGAARRYIESHNWPAEKAIYLHQENQGPSAARNNGILHSHGKYILPLDPDDTIEPTYIGRCVAILENQPEIKLVYCEADSFGAWEGQWPHREYNYETLLWYNLIHNSAIYRRLDYDKTQGYNPNMRHGLEDWDFYLSLLAPQDQVYCIDEILYHWRASAEQRTEDADAHQLELLRQIYHNHKDLYEPYHQDVVFFHEMWTYYEYHYQQAEKLRHTKAYRLGKALLSPLKRFKKRH